MKKRWFYIIHSGVALVVGAGLYLLFREHTYLHRLVALEAAPFADLQFFGDALCRYYLPDFLWAYSLYAGLCGIICPQGRQWLWPAVITFLMGAVWELAQHLAWTGGTGDVADLLMYGTAIAVAEIIFRRK